MKNLNLITILISVSSLSVQAAANTKGTETNTVTIPENVRKNYLDQLYFLKVDPKLLDKSLDLFPVIEAAKNDKNTAYEVFKNKFEVIKKNLSTKKKTQLGIDLENMKFNKNFDLSGVIDNINDSNTIYESALAVIQDEQLELESLNLALEHISRHPNPFKISQSITDYLMHYVQAHLDAFDKCKVKKIRECQVIGTKRTGSYKTIMLQFKTWLLAKQMTEGPAGIQKEFIRPDWKDLAKSVKYNLKVTTVPESLNYQYLRKVKNLDPDTAIKSMLSKLENLIKTFKKDKTSNDGDKLLYLNDLILRQVFVKIVYNTNYSQYEDKKPLTESDILIPIRLIEKYAQGVFQTNLVDGPESIKDKSIGTIFKLWLMSLQMFEEDGSKNNKYVTELIPIPEDWKSTIEKASIIESVSVAETKAVVNNDDTRNAALNVGNKKKNFFSMFGFK